MLFDQSFNKQICLSLLYVVVINSVYTFLITDIFSGPCDCIFCLKTYLFSHPSLESPASVYCVNVSCISIIVHKIVQIPTNLYSCITVHKHLPLILAGISRYDVTSYSHHMMWLYDIVTSYSCIHGFIYLHHCTQDTVDTYWFTYLSESQYTDTTDTYKFIYLHHCTQGNYRFIYLYHSTQDTLETYRFTYLNHCTLDTENTYRYLWNTNYIITVSLLTRNSPQLLRFLPEKAHNCSFVNI